MMLNRFLRRVFNAIYKERLWDVESIDSHDIFWTETRLSPRLVSKTVKRNSADVFKTNLQ